MKDIVGNQWKETIKRISESKTFQVYSYDMGQSLMLRKEQSKPSEEKLSREENEQAFKRQARHIDCLHYKKSS